MLKRMMVYFTLPLLLFLVMPPRGGWAQSPPEAFVPGPDVIVGNLPSLIQAGSNGTQVGLAMGTDTCNNGDVELNFFAMPNTDHPVMPQNLYRMSGGTNNDERFEQIGQSWVKHAFFALQQNACGFGCTPGSGGGNHLGVGCSNPDSASLNASQSGLGSRAWVNSFTGVFPSTANNHTGHTHDGTTHRILVEGNDLNTTMNPGATYYGEAQLVTPHEYAWCQTHPGQCNMYNNASYRQFTVVGTTSFSFSAVGSTVRMTPAINAWPGATIQTIEPEPGVDGRAFVAYKVTGPLGGIWRYEYAIYNQNLDRGIQSFTVPGGCGFGTPSNLEFHAPLNHPGIANDGTVGDAGYSNAPWTAQASSAGATWFTETFAQHPNANALRWGTLYNFRFQTGTPPTPASATIGFFKTGAPITVVVQGPATECFPTPTASPSPCPATISQNFDGVTAPALPPGWSSGASGAEVPWVTSTTTPVSPPNDAFAPDVDAFGTSILSTTITAPSDGWTLSFRNLFNLEAEGAIGPGYDGMVLEISSPNINGGAFTDIVDPAVGGFVVSGGYTRIIDDFFGSPIAGRPAWSGLSAGTTAAPAYITTTIHMPVAISGPNIHLRWRIECDNQAVAPGAAGVRIDNFSITPSACGGATPTPTPSATATPTPTATPSPTPTATATSTATATPDPCNSTIFREHFDGVSAPALPVSWAASFTPGAANCTPAGTCALGTNWATSATTPDTAPNCVFHDDPGCVTDSTLDTPSFYNFSHNQFLYFRHNYDLESGFDGALLEISINGAAFIDFVAAGGIFQSGGYNGTISSGTLSPIAGRPAWTGNSGGYITTSARMPTPLGGTQTVVLRFRLATDCSGAGTGWRVDTVESVYYSVSCQSPTPTPTPPPSPSPTTKALNLSTRMRVQTGDNVGIGGFIISGDVPKRVLLRAIGPSLTQFGVPNVLADPVLELHGPSTFTPVTNNNWRDTQEQEIQATGIPPANNLEAAIVANLAPGAYTAIVRGNGNTSGVALVEAYDLNQGVNARLANISTRAFVSTGDNIVIAGFMLGGNNGADRIVVRGIGPSLAAFGVSPPLANPTLELRNSNGALLMANNDWQDDPAQAAELTAAGLALTNQLESGIAMTLPPGLYTALLAGLNNGTGVGLVEIYDRGAP